jgi:HEAT repeat protein
MTAASEESLEFVSGFLDSPDEPVQEAAALALAEARSPAALDTLMAYWPKAPPNSSLQEVLLLAVAMTLLPAALEFLLEVVSRDERAAALAALSALAIHRHNTAVKQRIAEVVAKSKHAAVRERFQKKFAAVEK